LSRRCPPLAGANRKPSETPPPTAGVSVFFLAII